MEMTTPRFLADHCAKIAPRVKACRGAVPVEWGKLLADLVDAIQPLAAEAGATVFIEDFKAKYDYLAIDWRIEGHSDPSVAEAVAELVNVCELRSETALPRQDDRASGDFIW